MRSSPCERVLQPPTKYRPKGKISSLLVAAPGGKEGKTPGGKYAFELELLVFRAPQGTPILIIELMELELKDSLNKYLLFPSCKLA